MKKIIILVTMLGIAFNAINAHAQSSIQSIIGTLPVTANYWGFISGPSLGNPAFYQSDTISGKVDNTNPDNLYNQIKLDYSLNSNVSVGLVANWLMQTDNQSPLLMRESGFRVADKSIVKFGVFNWSGDFRYLFPTSNRAHNGGVTHLFQTLQTLSADISKWSIGLAQFHTLRLFNETGGGKKLEMYVSPYANYNFSDTTSATFALETYPIYFSGIYDMNGWNPAPYDISLGAAFNITKEINVNPVILTFPDHFNVNTTAFAAYLSAKLM